MTSFEKQLVLGVLAALAVKWLTTTTPATAAGQSDITQTTYFGAGADPFGYSYTVPEKAARGGL